jgi:glycosyltransferase involved in cell wall biosynthesis
MRWSITGNYINPDWFPFRDRFEGAAARKKNLTIGRLSRADPDKFPDDFPAFYEGLGLDRPRFRVMAWDQKMAKRFQNHPFDERWELLPPMTESQVDFLHSLDLFVYSVSGRFKESWGRAVVEAMLTGAVPLVPKSGGHHLENLVVHGESGFVCSGAEEYGHCARLLQDDPELRRRMSLRARQWAVETLCNKQTHLDLWHRAFARSITEPASSPIHF